MSKPMNYWNNKQHCIDESKKYKTINELKINSNGCYASILKHSWETDCFPNFVKRKPNGYWNNKERCIEEAKKYDNLSDFSCKSSCAYNYSKRNGWIDEIKALYDKTIKYHSFNEKIHSVYVYEFPDTKYCYVGRTNNLKNRHLQHIRDINDSLNKYCKKIGIDIPQPTLLKEGLNAEESQYYEDFFLNEYITKGWKALNIAKTGVNTGSLGAVCKWTYDMCAKEAKKYSKIIDFENGSQSAYNACKRNGWVYDFFSSLKKSDNYWDDYENCKRAFEDCSNARELIRKYGGCYNAIKRNGFNDLRYERKRKYRQTENS